MTINPQDKVRLVCDAWPMVVSGIKTPTGVTESQYLAICLWHGRDGAFFKAEIPFIALHKITNENP